MTSGGMVGHMSKVRRTAPLALLVEMVEKYGNAFYLIGFMHFRKFPPFCSPWGRCMDRGCPPNLGWAKSIDFQTLAG